MATILVVDDRPSNREYLSSLLGYVGHRTVEAANGQMALALAAAERPDLVITDILMPTMNGYELVQRMRKDEQLASLPVIFHTATYSEPEAQQLAQACGVRTVLPKPSEPAQVLEAVQRELGSASQGTVPAPANVRKAPDDTLTLYLRDLMGEGEADKSAVRRKEAKAFAESFTDKVVHLQRVMSRLSAIIEVGMEAVQERNPARLVELYFGAACDVVDSRYAAIGILNAAEDGLRYFFSKGLQAALYTGASGIKHPDLDAAVQTRRPLRLADREAVAKTLPPGHPQAATLLLVPVASKERLYGWLYFAEKQGGRNFSPEDERLAGIVALQLGLLYENADMYDVVQRHATGLQIEMTKREEAERLAENSRALLREAIDSVAIGFSIYDAEDRLVMCNEKYRNLYATSRDLIVLGARFEDIVRKRAERGQYKEAAGDIEGWVRKRVAQHRESDGRQFEQPLDDGRWLLILERRTSSGNIVGNHIDITDRKRAEKRIAQLNRVYAVLSGINALIVRTQDRDELLREACRIAVDAGQFKLAWIGLMDDTGARMMLAASEGSADYIELLSPELNSIQTEKNLLAQAVREKSPVVSNDIANDVRIAIRQQAMERGLRSLAVLPLIIGEEVIGVLALYAESPGFFDEAEMKLLLELAGDISFAIDHIGKSQKLEYLAYYDPLTGLANRSLFLERLEQQITAARQGQGNLAVFLLDIERFKAVNDALGRQYGDELLKEIAQRLVHSGGDATRFARIGADHFGVFRVESKNEEQYARLIESKLKEVFDNPFTVFDKEIRVSAKVGITMFPGDGDHAEVLLRNAEAALKQAKKRGERYVFFEARMTDRVAERLSLENKLRRALENRELVLHYQPKIELENRRIVGVEALIRWQSPELGLVPPVRFIPLLEETGLILEVGKWALSQAAVDHRRWVESKLPPVRVAVNVSPIQLRQRDFASVVEKAIIDGVAPVGIDLEITESVLMDNVQANIDKLKAARALGINIAIDDFGTGYSSLGYLAKLPVHSIKIDRSFVAAMLAEPDAATLVQTIISLAHSLRLKVCAEGVETEEQARMLRLLRCDEMQGYLFSKPLPADALVELLQAGVRN